MPDHDEKLVDDEPRGEGEERLIDKLKGGGVGTEDPAIVGEVSSTDIPPGTDGDELRLATSDKPVDHLEV